MDDEGQARAVESEIVEPETQVAKPLQPTSVDSLAQREDGLIIIDRAVQILTSLRRASIAMTYPHDWTRYKADDRVTCYLESLACWNLRALWGVDTLDPTDPYKIEHMDGTFAWAIDGSGYCNTTKTTISKATGICYSNEDFLVSRRLPPIKLEPEMKKAARQRLEGILVREAGGLKRVPVEELDDVWKGTWKNTSLCPKGRGFGSGAERKGAQVQETSEIPAQFQPKCSTCNTVLKFVQAGTTQQGKSYSAFWSCPSREHRFTMKHEDALAEAKRMESEAKAGEHA